MGSINRDIFPKTQGASLAPHLSAFAKVQESIDAAVVGVRQIAGHSFALPDDTLTTSSERLAGSLLRLREAVEMFIDQSVSAEKASESGFDEEKLLASIEKWQRRYQELEKEHAQMEERLLRLEEENKRLQNASLVQNEMHKEVLERIGHTLEIVDVLLTEEAQDEEYRNYH